MKRLTLVVVLVLFTLSSVMLAVSWATTGPGALLPDLRMARLQNFTIDTATIPGRTLLRYTTIAVNLGAGAFELRGQRPNTSTSLMTVTQRIYDGGGGATDVAVPTDMHWAGADGHNHWHSSGFVGSELERLADGSKVASTKTSFCLTDSKAFNLSFPGSPDIQVYKGCVAGGSTSLSARIGVSVGWGDRYSHTLPLQWIDITDLAPGMYRLWVTADPSGWFSELDDSNNFTWTDLQLTGGTVSVLGWGPSAGDLDTTPPTFQSAAVNETVLTMTYNEVLNSGSPPPNDSFLVSGGHAVTAVSVAGSTVSLTLSPAVVNGETVTLSYTPGAPAIEDVAGNDAAVLNDAPVTNDSPPADTTPPAFQSAAVNGSALTMTYDEVLNSGLALPNDSFVVTGHAVTAATVTGATVSLTLSPAVVNGETITLSYTPGAPAIEDVVGNDAAALSTAPVTNSTPSPTLTLLPNGDGPHDVVIKDQNSGTTNLYKAIDDTIASTDNATTYVRNNSSKSGSYLIHLTNTPASFFQMQTLTIDVRARTTGATNDQTTLFAQIFQADGVTPLTEEIAVATNPGPSSFTTISGVSFTGLAGGSKAIWDGAQLRLRWAYTPVGTQETTQLRVTAVEVDGTF